MTLFMGPSHMDRQEASSRRWPMYDDTDPTTDEYRELGRRLKPLGQIDDLPPSHMVPARKPSQPWTSSVPMCSSYTANFRSAVNYPYQAGGSQRAPINSNSTPFLPRGERDHIPESFPDQRRLATVLQMNPLLPLAPGIPAPAVDHFRSSPERLPREMNALRLNPDRRSDIYMDQRHGEKRSVEVAHSQRRPSNRDEFDGPHQYLQRLAPESIAAQERDLPHMPTYLVISEQDDILSRIHHGLSQCAFDFMAKYQFPIPLEADKRPVKTAADREWTEWVFLIKRLATKRRIPSRVLYHGQIKQLVTVLENSLEMRHATKHQSRPLKDDRNVLQLISAGIQVAKILKDATAMRFLDQIYSHTERLIHSRRTSSAFLAPAPMIDGFLVSKG